VKVFFALAGRGVDLSPDEIGRLAAFPECTGVDVLRFDEVAGSVLSFNGCTLRGLLKGVLKGERKGLERVLDAASILRRFAAGVDILIALVLLEVSDRSIVVEHIQ
jgi:hypothetical protein